MILGADQMHHSGKLPSEFTMLALCGHLLFDVATVSRFPVTKSLDQFVLSFSLVFYSSYLVVRNVYRGSYPYT